MVQVGKSQAFEKVQGGLGFLFLDVGGVSLCEVALEGGAVGAQFGPVGVGGVGPGFPVAGGGVGVVAGYL